MTHAEWLRAHALDVALYLSIVTALCRVLYAAVARIVAPYPRARHVVESVAAISPDVLRAVVQIYRAVTGRDLPAPLVDQRDAEIAQLRGAAAATGARVIALDAEVSRLRAGGAS